MLHFALAELACADNWDMRPRPVNEIGQAIPVLHLQRGIAQD